MQDEPTEPTPAAVDVTQVLPTQVVPVQSRPSARAPARVPWYRKPHVAFIAVACAFGLALAITLPPLAGFDEGVHFLRAWQVSNGHVGAQTGHRAGDPAPILGANVPSGLEHGLSVLLFDGILRADNARRVWSHIGDAAPSGPPTFVDFSAAAVYPPVPYLPSAIGIWVGRRFGASPFMLVLLARLAELATFVALVAVAIKRLPTRRWVLVVVALTPVALFQASTVSADAITTAFAFLVIADALALTAAPVGAVPRALLIETVLATLALALCKQPYVLAAGLLLLPAWRHRRQIGVVIGATFAVGGALALSWTSWANAHYLAPDFLPPSLGGQPNYLNNNVDPTEQLTYLRGHPFALAGAVGRMITHHGGSIAPDVVAQVSPWHAPALIAALVGCGIVTIVILDADRLPGGGFMRGLALGLVAMLIGVSLFLAYVGWNAVRAPRIDGYQGRYLLVMLAIVALVVMPDRRKRSAGSNGASAPDRSSAGLGVVGWSALMLLVIVIGLGGHSYG